MSSPTRPRTLRPLVRALLDALNRAHRASRKEDLLEHLRQHPHRDVLQIARGLGWRPADVATVLDHLELAGRVTAHWHDAPARRLYTVTRRDTH